MLWAGKVVLLIVGSGFLRHAVSLSLRVLITRCSGEKKMESWRFQLQWHTTFRRNDRRNSSGLTLQETFLTCQPACHTVFFARSQAAAGQPCSSQGSIVNSRLLCTALRARWHSDRCISVILVQPPTPPLSVLSPRRSDPLNFRV